MKQAKAAGMVVTYFMSAPLFWLAEQVTFRIYIGGAKVATRLLRCCLDNPKPNRLLLRVASGVIYCALIAARSHQANLDAFETLHAITMASIIAAR